MTANAIRNTVSVDSNLDASSALHRQYRLANAYKSTSLTVWITRIMF